jgi:UPF0716 protein FxsA
MSSLSRSHDARVETKEGSTQILVEVTTVMHVFRVMAIAILVMPIVELIAFVLVAEAVGFGAALTLLILVSLAGVVLLGRVARTSAMRRGGTTAEVRITATSFTNTGATAGIAGILLTVPGFITGLLGASAMVPTFRRWMLAGLRRGLAAKTRGNTSDVIDLEPTEWRALPTRQLPRRKRRTGE